MILIHLRKDHPLSYLFEIVDQRTVTNCTTDTPERLHPQLQQFSYFFFLIALHALNGAYSVVPLHTFVI